MARPKSTGFTSAKWPPEALKKFIEHEIGPNGETKQAVIDGLKYLLKEDQALQNGYLKLSSLHGTEKVNGYLIKVCHAFMQVDSLNIVGAEEYWDWLREIRDTAEKLGQLLEDKTESRDLILPAWRTHTDIVLKAMLDGWGDDAALDELAGKAPFMKRAFHQMRLSSLILTIRQLAQDELCEGADQNIKEPASRPVHYVEREFGIEFPSRLGDGQVQGRENAFARAVKQLTLDTFSKLHGEFVASVVNALLVTDRFTAGTISDIPTTK